MHQYKTSLRDPGKRYTVCTKKTDTYTIIHPHIYIHLSISTFFGVCVCECECRHVFIDRCVWAWRSTVWQSPEVLNRFGGEILCFGSSMILHHTLLGYGGHKSYEGQIDAHGEQGCQCRLLRYHLKALFKPQLGHKDLQTLVGQTVYYTALGLFSFIYLLTATGCFNPNDH